MKTFKAFYIGDDFYIKSGNIMSSIYTEDGQRTDWGKVQMALANGQEVRIRQASDSELLRAYKALNEYTNRKSTNRA